MNPGRDIPHVCFHMSLDCMLLLSLAPQVASVNPLRTRDWRCDLRLSTVRNTKGVLTAGGCNGAMATTYDYYPLLSCTIPHGPRHHRHVTG